MTPEERRVWWHLRQLNRLGAHFRRQAAIGPYFVDLRRGIVVEIDGGQHGGHRDRARDAVLAGRGFRVLRFWNSEVRENVEGVVEVIAVAVRRVDRACDRPPP
jgi:very-short-patch-repair endonuclease